MFIDSTMSAFFNVNILIQSGVPAPRGTRRLQYITYYTCSMYGHRQEFVVCQRKHVLITFFFFLRLIAFGVCNETVV